jgi:hypothetical protein
MPVPESQLETWSRQGAITASSATYRSVQSALVADSSAIRDLSYDIYLQGSYKNDTNIRSDSDVDVVVQLKSTFGYDLTALDQNQKSLFSTSYPNGAAYRWEDFRGDVLRSLRAYYGDEKVTEGNRSLKVVQASGRLAADVIPAIEFHKYDYFFGVGAEHYVEGIRFWPRNDNRVITNFPKLHYENGIRKHSESGTNGWYKPTVRMFKNFRNYAIEHGVISANVAPSYFVECLLYNVPDDAFGESLQNTFVRAWNWLWAGCVADQLRCQNRQMQLFGLNPEQWNVADANCFLNALLGIWNNW